MGRKRKKLDIILSPETEGVIYTYKMEVDFDIEFFTPQPTIRHYEDYNYYQTEKEARKVVDRYFAIYQRALEAGTLAGFRRLGFHRIPLTSLIPKTG